MGQRCRQRGTELPILLHHWERVVGHCLLLQPPHSLPLSGGVCGHRDRGRFKGFRACLQPMPPPSPLLLLPQLGKEFRWNTLLRKVEVVRWHGPYSLWCVCGVCSETGRWGLLGTRHGSLSQAMAGNGACGGGGACAGLFLTPVWVPRGNWGMVCRQARQNTQGRKRKEEHPGRFTEREWDRQACAGEMVKERNWEERAGSLVQAQQVQVYTPSPSFLLLPKSSSVCRQQGMGKMSQGGGTLTTPVCLMQGVCSADSTEYSLRVQTQARQVWQWGSVRHELVWENHWEKVRQKRCSAVQWKR